MADNQNDRRRDDARWIIATAPGIDAHGRRFGKGERVIYYPVFDEIVSGMRADEVEQLSITDSQPAA